MLIAFFAFVMLLLLVMMMVTIDLSVAGFLLPPDSGEKVTLGLTVLLAFSVFMLLVAENMPPTSEYIPLIGKMCNVCGLGSLPSFTVSRTVHTYFAIPLLI